MKNRFLGFLKKYWLSILLSVIMILGLIISGIIPYDKSEHESGIYFDATLIYLIIVVPIYSFMYGILSYVRFKKALIPQSILYIVSLVGYLLFNLIYDKEINLDILIGSLFMSIYPMFFVMFGTFLSRIFLKIKKVYKNNN